MKNTYYYILMTQKSLFANQVIEEILREKSNYYTAEVRQKDFWILTSPKFIFEKAGFNFKELMDYQNFKSYHYIKNADRKIKKLLVNKPQH